MRRLILYRLAQFPLILGIIYLITFALAWVAPGDPFANERAMDPLVKHNLEERFHADSAWKFLSWYPYNILVHGDFGPSMQYKEWSVNDIIKSSLPVSVTLGLLAVAIALIVGVGVGTLAAVRRGGAAGLDQFIDHAFGHQLADICDSRGDADVRCLCASIAGEWMGFAGQSHSAGYHAFAGADGLHRAAYTRGDARYAGRGFCPHCAGQRLIAHVRHLETLPAKFFSAGAFFSRPGGGGDVDGLFVVEKVFNIPGLGQHFVNSVLNRDRTLILGVVIVYSVFLLTFNLLVDMAYTLVDPRISLADGGGK